MRRRQVPGINHPPLAREFWTSSCAGGPPVKAVQKSGARPPRRAPLTRQLPSRLTFSPRIAAATFGLLGIFKLVQKSKTLVACKAPAPSHDRPVGAEGKIKMSKSGRPLP